MKTFRLLFAAASSLLFLSPLIGAPIPISDATYSGSFTAGTPETITGNANVAGLTTSEGTFVNLVGATANGVIAQNANSSVGTSGLTTDQVVTGLTVNDGINNLRSTTTGNNFQFGGALDSSTRFFIIESALVSGTAGDPATVTLINASNATVGTYTLPLTAAQFTSSIANNTSTALATLQYTAGTAGNTSNPSKLGGVTFSLADFTGSGDLSTVTGIRVSSSDALDPNVVGAFSVSIRTLAASGTTLNWNTAAAWLENLALASDSRVLINSNSAANSIVANSVDGSGHPASIANLSFDIGAATKNVQGNATVTTDRLLPLSGGTDALGGTDLIHISSSTTGVVNIGTNSGLGNLLLSFLNPGTIDVENASATLNFGPTVIFSGTVNVTKTGAGTLTFADANTFGSNAGNTFTISNGTVLANTPASGANSATGAAGVSVSGTATLGGSGQITPGAGKQVSVASGGIVSPGASGLGTLTLNGTNTAAPLLVLSSGAKLQFDLNSTGPANFQSDTIAIANGATGDVVFNGNSINFTNLSAGTLPDGAYTLFTAAAANNYSGLTTDANGVITAGLTIGTGLSGYNASLRVVGNTIVLNIGALPSPTPTPTPTPTPPPATDILFVGNSFTHGNNEPALSYNNANITDENGTGYGGVPGIFKKLTTQAGLAYNVSIEAVSAETLSWHYTNKAAIIGQSKWEIVVLQELSTGPLPTAHGGDPSAFYTGADNLQNLVLANNSAAKVLLYETWTSPASATNQGYNGVLQAMQDDLQVAYFKAFYDFGFTTVARVGDAFMRCVDQGLADPNNSGAPGTFNIWSTADNRHASQYGSYLSAAVFFEKITGLDPRTLSVTSGSAAADLGISPTDATNLNRIAYEITALPDPTPPPTPATVHTLKGSGSTLNWNTSASWIEGTALASSSGVLINSSSADNSIVANSVDGNNHPAFLQTVSFDIGSNTKNLQGNATLTVDRALPLIGGTDALGGTDLLHLSSTTTGTVNIGTNSGLGNLLVSFLNPGSIDVESPSARLNMGPTAIISGAVDVAKTGLGTLTLAGPNTFGTGHTFTISAGTVLANTAVSGTQSSTGVGNVVVSANTTLGGTGQITPGTGNQISVVNGGALAPGAGIGTLTINGANTSANVLALAAGAKLQFDLTSSGPGNFQSDQIALINGATADIAFGGNAITFTDLSFGGLPQGAYTLFTATASDNYGGLTTDGGGFITAGLTLGTGVEAYTANLQATGPSLVLNLTPKPYTSWKSLNFTLAERSDPNISGDLAAPAGDGISNLLKYALNLDPHVSGVSGLPTVGTMTAADNMQYLTLTYKEVISATDLSYVPEVGSDLVHWNFGSTFTEVVSSTNDPNGITRTVVVQDLTPMASASFRVMRLRVTKI